MRLRASVVRRQTGNQNTSGLVEHGVAVAGDRPLCRSPRPRLTAEKPLSSSRVEMESSRRTASLAPPELQRK